MPRDKRWKDVDKNDRYKTIPDILTNPFLNQSIFHYFHLPNPLTLMKKSSILLFLLAVMLSVCGQSQFAVGVEGGSAVTFLRGNKEIKKATDPAVSYSTGIFLHFYAAENQYVRAGIQIEKRGAREKDEYSGEVYHYNYNYLDVPFVMRVTTRGKTKLFADLGFFVGYLLSL